MSSENFNKLKLQKKQLELFGHVILTFIPRQNRQLQTISLLCKHHWAQKLNVFYICSKHVDNSYILQMKQHEPEGQMLSHLGNVTYLLDVTNEFRGSNGCHYLVVMDATTW